MVRYLVPKKGVPVLASARVDGAAQSCCVLVAKYCDAPLQISFYLQYTNFIHGFDDPQTFTLIYDADNLIRDATTLKTATTLLPHHQLALIARAGNPQIRVLTLTLAKPCRIRCPPSASTGTLAAKSGFEAPFHQLVKLAEATEIHILLDYNWVHADNREPLERFFRQPNLFTGFPDGNDRFRYVDWTDFNTIEEQDAPPPSYAKAVDADASRKRSRHAATRSLSTSPASKRHQYDPGSPTEIATATPSPRPSHISATAALALQDAISRAVEAQLPALLAKQHLTTIFDEANDQAYSLRNQADGDFEEVIADHKINVDTIKEDCIRELGEVVDDKLYKFKEQTDDIVATAVDEMENKSSELGEGMYDGLETFLNVASTTLKQVRKGQYSGTRRVEQLKPDTTTI
ncbi:hypothetical protein CC77DRAFT_1000974 [Alternaria alternata]|uniref:Uncharacterized protein n=1 Tax=Alternaria alternata TaxID=5599 RepID=A0A177D5Q3_ALTAL|nr:hypothetical protein CC77DRAFT_1000974 [Alternaria alternata]OAG14490.1 hypothetical protein CC77DRAFT_1000974 [Alternaria alternata]